MNVNKGAFDLRNVCNFLPCTTAIFGKKKKTLVAVRRMPNWQITFLLRI